MRTVIIHPPFCDPSCPPLGIAYLASELRIQKNEVIVKDLNIDFWDFIESENWKAFCVDTINGLIQNFNPQYSRKNIDELIKGTLALADLNSFCKNVNRKKAGIEEEYLYLLRQRQISLSLTNAIYTEIQLSYRNLKLRSGWNDLSILVSEASNPKNLFSIWTGQSKQINKIIENVPDWIGISISFEDQLLPALSLACHLKKQVTTRIICGGSLFVSFAKHIGEKTPLWKYFDGIVIGPGEKAIHKLKKILNNQKIINDNEYKKFSNGSWLLNINRQPYKPQPLPDFQGFPLQEYRSQGIVLPFRVFPKCSWGKCMFCADHKYCFYLTVNKENYEKIIYDIKKICEKYNAKGIYFLDAELPLSFMLSFSKSLIKTHTNIKWGANARFSSEIANSKIANELFSGGCRLLRFGLESASDKLLIKMKKGITVQLAKKSLRSVSESGIVTHVYMMRNYPGENIDDWKKSEKFILSNSKYIDMFNISNFILYENSPLWEQNKSVQVATNSFWAYPKLNDARQNKIEYNEQLYKIFFKLKGPTKNCIYTSDTILISDKMTKGIFGKKECLKKNFYCKNCKLIAFKDRVIKLPFELISLKQNYHLKSFKLNSSCLLTDGLGKYWQAPFFWEIFLDEITINKVLKLINYETINWGIKMRILKLIQCDKVHKKELSISDKQPEDIESIILPTYNILD